MLLQIFALKKLLNAAQGVAEEQTRPDIPKCPTCKNNHFVKRERWNFICASPTHKPLNFEAADWDDPDAKAAIELLEKAKQQWE